MRLQREARQPVVANIGGVVVDGAEAIDRRQTQRDNDHQHAGEGDDDLGRDGKIDAFHFWYPLTKPIPPSTRHERLPWRWGTLRGWRGRDIFVVLFCASIHIHLCRRQGSPEGSTSDEFQQRFNTLRRSPDRCVRSRVEASSRTMTGEYRLRTPMCFGSIAGLRAGRVRHRSRTRLSRPIDTNVGTGSTPRHGIARVGGAEGLAPRPAYRATNGCAGRAPRAAP